jgi:hypothetical protein
MKSKEQLELEKFKIQADIMLSNLDELADSMEKNFKSMKLIMYITQAALVAFTFVGLFLFEAEPFIKTPFTKIIVGGVLFMALFRTIGESIEMIKKDRALERKMSAMRDRRAQKEEVEPKESKELPN